MNDANPPVCAAWIPLVNGRAACELPVGHVGPHRAADPPNTSDGQLVHWSDLPCRLSTRDATPGAA